MASVPVPTALTAKVLVVDDEAPCRRVLARQLTHQGHAVSTAPDLEQAVEILREQQIDVVLTDLRMPNGNGLELVRRAAEIDPLIPCIVMTGYGSTEQSVEALRAGAYWYLEKPFDRDFRTLHRLLGHALELRRRQRVDPERRRSPASARPTIIGKSAVLREVIRTAEKVAISRATVLVTGESGTGKELIARVVYTASPRCERPFVPINCGAIPSELLESELFGHVRGAFTNAHQAREGRFQLAHGGTIFLDEIGDMSLGLQPKLLRVLQDGTFEQVGASTTNQVDVRVIAATNQDLAAAIREHRFLEREAEAQRKKAPRLTQAAIERLCAYHWPGNVRELENLMERVVILSDKDEIDARDLPPFYTESHIGTPDTSLPEDGIRFREAVGRYEEELIRKALERAHGNKTEAALLLDLNRTTLLERMKRLGISVRSPATTVSRRAPRRPDSREGESD
jgi:two-component system, NtrC family, response regulator AtoC